MHEGQYVLVGQLVKMVDNTIVASLITVIFNEFLYVTVRLNSTLPWAQTVCGVLNGSIADMQQQSRPIGPRGIEPSVRYPMHAKGSVS